MPLAPPRPQLVADALGLSPPALLKRFGTKEALMVRALAPPADLPWVERLFRGPDDRPLPEQLLEIAKGAMALFGDSTGAMLTLRASGIDLQALLEHDHPTSPVRVRAALVAFFAEARAAGRLRPCEPDRLATAFIGALQARALESHLFGVPLEAAEQQAHAAAIVDLLWRGARPDPLEAL